LISALIQQHEPLSDLLLSIRENIPADPEFSARFVNALDALMTLSPTLKRLKNHYHLSPESVNDAAANAMRANFKPLAAFIDKSDLTPTVKSFLIILSAVISAAKNEDDMKPLLTKFYEIYETKIKKDGTVFFETKNTINIFFAPYSPLAAEAVRNISLEQVAAKVGIGEATLGILFGEDVPLYKNSPRGCSFSVSGRKKSFVEFSGDDAADRPAMVSRRLSTLAGTSNISGLPASRRPTNSPALRAGNRSIKKAKNEAAVSVDLTVDNHAFSEESVLLLLLTNTFSPVAAFPALLVKQQEQLHEGDRRIPALSRQLLELTLKDIHAPVSQLYSVDVSYARKSAQKMKHMLTLMRYY